jgi:hypothetical protein
VCWQVFREKVGLGPSKTVTNPACRTIQPRFVEVSCLSRYVKHSNPLDNLRAERGLRLVWMQENPGGSARFPWPNKSQVELARNNANSYTPPSAARCMAPHASVAIMGQPTKRICSSVFFTIFYTIFYPVFLIRFGVFLFGFFCTIFYPVFCQFFMSFLFIFCIFVQIRICLYFEFLLRFQICLDFEFLSRFQICLDFFSNLEKNYFGF